GRRGVRAVLGWWPRSFGPAWRLGSLRFEDLDGVARRELHHGPLLVSPPARPEAAPLHLPLAVRRVHRQHPNVPDLLDRFLDLGLVGLRFDQERVAVALQGSVGLFRDDRADDDVAGALHSPATSRSLLGPERASSASVVNRTRSA